MIQVQTMLTIADNSGARKVMCIKVLGGSKRRYAHVGDVIKVAIKEAIPTGKVKKGTVADAVVVRTRKDIKREDGSSVRFDDNAAVLINAQKQPIGTRILGPEKESPIHLSNIAIYNKKAKKADKVKIEANENGKKRIFKSDGKEV